MALAFLILIGQNAGTAKHGLKPCFSEKESHLSLSGPLAFFEAPNSTAPSPASLMAFRTGEDSALVFISSDKWRHGETTPASRVPFWIGQNDRGWHSSCCLNWLGKRVQENPMLRLLRCSINGGTPKWMVFEGKSYQNG